MWKSNWRWIVGAYIFGAVVLPILVVAGLTCYALAPAMTSVMLAQPIVIVTNPFIEVKGMAPQYQWIAAAVALVLCCTLSGLLCVMLASVGVLGMRWWKRAQG